MVSINKTQDTKLMDMKITKILMALLVLGLFTQCQEDEDFSLDGALPEKPAFTLEAVPDDPNRFVYTDLSDGNFTRLWEFGENAQPKTSVSQKDTVLFKKKGMYTVRLHISASDGSGTAFSEETITIAEDAALGCTEILASLTNDCASKCWRMSDAAGSVSVGPTPFSSEWFSSSELELTQLDDVWCFDAESFIYDYQNNGSSFSACQGYIEDENYPFISGISFEFIEGGGEGGLDRIVLTDEAAWMGVEDSGPIYDISEVSSTKLVLLAPIKPCDGAASNGFFTLIFEANN